MSFSDLFSRRSASAGERNAASAALQTHQLNLDKAIVSLRKRSGIDLSAHQARVVVVMDYSGSMRQRLTDLGAPDSSEVQRTLTKLLPFALRFDDDGLLDVWLFSDGYERLPKMTGRNFATYVNKVVKPSGFCMRGTYYAPVIQRLMQSMVDDNGTPVYVLFVTDGDNADRDETDTMIRESAAHNIFIQFIGISGSDFSYLRHLDDLDCRACDNTGFRTFQSLADADDAQVYDVLIAEYAKWLEERGLI